MPAFTPNPTKNNTKTAACEEPASLDDDAAKPEKSRLPERELKRRKPISRHPVPACDITKNRTPAWRVTSLRCSKLIRQYAASAITSHAIRKKNAFDAVKTAV